MKDKIYRANRSVYDRIKAICKGNNLPMPSNEYRQEIGKHLNELFFQSKIKKKGYYYKALQKEEDGEFMVLFYPAYFTKVMDAIIWQTINV